jgi:hypothetical protein
MNTYRRETYGFDVNKVPIILSARHAQQSQRYQKKIIKTPNSTVNFSLVGLRQLRRQVPAPCSFTCSDEALNRIYRDGVGTVELCTLEQNEVPEAWEVTEVGTRCLASIGHLVDRVLVGATLSSTLKFASSKWGPAGVFTWLPMD